MKQMLVTLIASCLLLSAGAAELKWLTDLPAAQAEAKKENKSVLLDFTGSDWCGWCKKLKAEVFDTKAFAEYAGKNLVLVEVDFPAEKPQTAALKKANAELQKKFKVRGYPTIVLLSADGKELWRSAGYMPGGPQAWIGQFEKAKKQS